MNDLNWKLWFQTLLNALNQGHPPLYAQLATATAVFVALRIYFLWKRNKLGAIAPSPEWLTTVWIGVLILLSMGVMDFLQFFYREYLRTIYYNIIT